MGSWLATRVANAVVDALIESGLTDGIVPQRATGAEFTLEELQTPRVLVVPLDDNQELGPGRGEAVEECRLYIAIMHQTRFDDTAEHDGRADQLDAMREFFRTKREKVAGAIYVAGQIVSPIADNLMVGVYTGLLTLTYRAFRE